MTACPTCGRPPRPQSPIEAVIAGQIGSDTAPLLTAVWTTIRALMRAVDGRAVSQQALVAQVMLLTGCAERTAQNCIAAAVRAGHLTREYRSDGTPRRRRSHLRWKDTA